MSFLVLGLGLKAFLRHVGFGLKCLQRGGLLEVSRVVFSWVIINNTYSPT